MKLGAWWADLNLLLIFSPMKLGAWWADLNLLPLHQWLWRHGCLGSASALLLPVLPVQIFLQLWLLLLYLPSLLLIFLLNCSSSGSYPISVACQQVARGFLLGRLLLISLRLAQGKHQL